MLQVDFLTKEPPIKNTPVLEQPLGKSKKRADDAIEPEEKPQPDEKPQSTARVYVDLLDMVNEVVRYRKRLKEKDSAGNPISVLSYLDSILRPVVSTDYRKVLDEKVKQAHKSKE